MTKRAPWQDWDDNRARPGPKPLPKGQALSERVQARLKPSEVRALEERASKAGQTKGGYLRLLLLRDLSRDR